MKIMIASDSYKGSLSSKEVAHYIKKGILDVFPHCQVDQIMIGDGGEGTAFSIIEQTGGRLITINTYNALNQPIKATYGLLKKDCAIIDMASASGLTLVKENNVLKANTYGTGLLIKDALNQGCKTIYLGIGGSATNDGGIGMAHALGIRFLDCHQEELEPIPLNLPLIETIDMENFDQRVFNTQFIIMCDVSNPLCGPQGASAIFGPQKGAKCQDIKFLDQGLQHLANVVKKTFHQNYQDLPGAGAAGGLGFGLVAFCHGQLHSGIETILKILDFEDKIKDCDLVITGEGCLDYQSIYGKVPIGVASIAKKLNIPTIAIAGSIGEEIEPVYQYLDAIESSVVRPGSLSEAINQASNNVYQATIRIMKSMSLGMTLTKK